MKTAELFDVRGLVTIVTGAASGIGLAYAEVMADNGARVTLIDQDTFRLKPPCGGLRNGVATSAGRPSMSPIGLACAPASMRWPPIMAAGCGVRECRHRFTARLPRHERRTKPRRGVRARFRRALGSRHGDEPHVDVRHDQSRRPAYQKERERWPYHRYHIGGGDTRRSHCGMPYMPAKPAPPIWCGRPTWNWPNTIFSSTPSRRDHS